MELKSLTVEYLIIIKQEGSFCESDDAFLNFLCVDSSISIVRKEESLSVELKKGVKFKVLFKIESDLVPSGKERYFKLILISKEADKASEFNELTVLLEKIICKLHPEVSINVLWNDISRLNAVEGYILINEVENLLRRLIASFMLTKVGLDYPKSHIPIKVETRDSELKVNYADYLHQTYFSDLSTILFEGQREVDFRNIGEIQRFVERHISDGKTEIKIEDIQGVISKSLWEKHFSKDTDYKKSHLEGDLESLNKLRNDIAHNRHISRETLGKIKGLSKKIIKVLNLELAGLENIKLTDEEINIQVHNHNSRILNAERILSGHFSEQLIAEFYKQKFSKSKITFADYPNSFGDFLVHLNENDLIAVEVKSISTESLRKVKKDYFEDKNMIKRVPILLSGFLEFHFVFVLKQIMNEVDMTYVSELSSYFHNISPKIKMIIGYIDRGGNFTPMDFSISSSML
ncbi:hypothetical protein ACTJKC_02195 [Pedobacter sp. 22226]|uniref:hypothetical protein n=1 Tax=Pedobacter sp. 22226 TaxID=3453894 RepID=UPI003F83C2A2